MKRVPQTHTPQYDFFPKSIRDKLPPLYAQEKVKDPIVHVKFFTPWSNWTWYATEFDGNDIFFGWVVGLENELGYFSLSEMKDIRGPVGLKIERDIYFEPKPLSQVMANYGERMPAVMPAVIRKSREMPKDPACSACGGPLVYMGTLGKKEWYRCRNCGMEFHKDVSRKPRGRMPSVAPQTGSAWATPDRKLRDRLERERKSDPDGFYGLVKQIRQEIKNRGRGRITMFPDIGLGELRTILNEAERMYR